MKLLADYTQASGKSSFKLEQNSVQLLPNARIKSGANPSSATEVLQHLTEAYGVSNHEERVREMVRSLLPAWATARRTRRKSDRARRNCASRSKAPRLLVIAHMDEIGFEVKSIAPDGRLEVVWKGGGVQSYFSGHPALVHTGTGDREAVMELPENWERRNFNGPPIPVLNPIVWTSALEHSGRSGEAGHSRGRFDHDSESLPAAARTRANGRSFDDRVGDTALIAALWALGNPVKDRDITFVFSTGEELGLVGAGALAKSLASQGREPDFVFAIDTFVSADSPLESKRFGDAQIGKGFVVRAVDNSNIVPRAFVEKVMKLARDNQIPAQFGVTGGGNDGSTFVRYGSIDVALGWPLRYSHSPAEVVDTRDVDALGRIVAAIARSW